VQGSYIDLLLAKDSSWVYCKSWNRYCSTCEML